MTKSVVSISLDEETVKIWNKIPFKERSQAIREWLKQKQEDFQLKHNLQQTGKQLEKLLQKETT